MSRPRSVPRLCRHKASGRAIVTIQGRDHYLGPYGSPEAQEAYDRLIAEWLAAGRPTVVKSVAQATTGPTINEILLQYIIWAEAYYGDTKTGQNELANLRHALRVLKKLYGSTPARDFGPRALKAIQKHMVQQSDLCRREINKRVSRIKRFFKWATSEELVPPSVFHGLQTVDGLRMGRTTARESQPVQPVSDAVIEATLPFLSPQVAAMVQVQRLSGARPSEICQMRLADLDRSGDVWIYRPVHHKTAYRGVAKEILLGPRCQGILEPFISRPDDAYLFSPAEAEDWRNAQRVRQQSRTRRTKVYPCERRRVEQKKQEAVRRRAVRRPQRDHYDASSYRQAIEYAVKKAAKNGVELPHWFPYQIRHTAGTEIRKQHGLEAAQVILGHTRADVTQMYAERNQKLALEVARTCG